MGEIKRWWASDLNDRQGAWWRMEARRTQDLVVLASDHDAAMAEKDREINRLTASLNSAYADNCHELNRERWVVEAQKAEIARLKAELDKWGIIPGITRPVDKASVYAVASAGGIVEKLKAEVQRLADDRTLRDMEIARLKAASKQWGLEPSASDIVDEIADRLRR